MIRPFTLLCFCAFAAAGAWLYQIKHAVAMKDRALVEIRRQTDTSRQRIDILRAEWALLNEPDRLRQTATRALTLEPMQPQHFVRPTDLERRLPAVVAFAGAPNIFAAPPPTPAMIAAARAAATATAEAPAPQALVAALAAQRAEQASRPVQAPAARAPTPPRPVTRPPEPIVPASVPATPVSRPSVPQTAIASALGGASLGRPLLAPPVPIAPAAAATLNGR